jgi:hypothetical protein
MSAKVHVQEAERFTHSRFPDDDLHVERYTDSEIEKEYDVFIVYLESQPQYVLKYSADTYEEMVYTRVIINLGVGPPFIGAERDRKNGAWLLTEFVGDCDLRMASMNAYDQAVRKLAKLHSLYWEDTGIARSFLRRERDSHRELLGTMAQLAERSDAEITSDLYSGIVRAVTRIIEMPQTIIHCDPLPNNIRANANAVWLIDWGSASYGSYAYDLSRLLSVSRDKNNTLLTTTDEQVQVLDMYVRECHTLGLSDINEKDVWYDFQCGRICNYAEIVCAFIECGWDRTSWYRANLSGIADAIAAIT